MTLGEMKRRVLELVFSYSVAGSEIPATYNNQADYEGMIPGLVNQAEIEIATSVKRIYESVKVSDLERTEVDGMERYLLPSKCWLPLTNGLLICLPRHRHGRYTDYRMLGGKYLVLPPGRAEFLTLEYWRYPERIDNDSPEDTELDNTPDVHEAIVFYVAGHLLLYDDAYRSKVLLAEYESRKGQLKEAIWLEVEPIHNIYYD